MVLIALNASDHHGVRSKIGIRRKGTLQGTVWGRGQEWMEVRGRCGQDNSLEPLQRLFDVMLEECSVWKEEKWAVLLGSLTLLLPTQVPFPNKISCFVGTCVSSDNSFLSVRQEPSFGPWKGSAFLQQYREENPGCLLWAHTLAWPPERGFFVQLSLGGQD